MLNFTENSVLTETAFPVHFRRPFYGFRKGVSGRAKALRMDTKKGGRPSRDTLRRFVPLLSESVIR